MSFGKASATENGRSGLRRATDLRVRSPDAQFGSKGNCNILLFDEVMGQNLSGGGHRAVVFSPSLEVV